MNIALLTSETCCTKFALDREEKGDATDGINTVLVTSLRL
jgi:hypothetical protein